MAVKLNVDCPFAQMNRVGRAATERQRRPAARMPPMCPGRRKGETRRNFTASRRVFMLERGGQARAVRGVRGIQGDTGYVLR